MIQLDNSDNDDLAPRVGGGAAPMPGVAYNPTAGGTRPRMPAPPRRFRPVGGGPRPVPSTPLTLNPHTLTTNADPGNDGALTGQTYVPGGDPRLAATQGDVTHAQAALVNAPSVSDETEQLYNRYRPLLTNGAQNRFAAAKGVFQNLAESQDLSRQRGIRSIGQAASALGRTGAGMTTNDLTDLESSLGNERERTLRQLSADTTEGDINDRFRTLGAGFEGASANNADRYRRVGALQDVDHQQFDQGRSNRDEYRTERGFQVGEHQRSLENRVRQRELENAEREARFRRGVVQSSLGGQGTPSFEDVLRQAGGY